MNPFSIRKINGFPALFKDGKPFNQIAFWSSDVNEEDFAAFRKAGITLFTCFRSGPYFDNPYWVGENEYDFSYYDKFLNLFREAVPDGYIIPRIFVSAPYWWLERHPEELTCYAKETPYTRDPRGTYHESFASELWKQEQGNALRQLLRHFKSAPYGDRIAGIHIAGGSCGEWHYWGNVFMPDCGRAMSERFGKPIPPPEKRGPDFFKCFYTSTVDAIDHFCRIVKEESDYLTAVFYGYLNESANLYAAHCAVEEFLKLESVDIVSAPHTYARRPGGMDGYFRAFPASLARHGKLFLDESDDRTPLAVNHYYAGKRISAETPGEAVELFWREFGNASTHCLGQWFMDIDGGMFRDELYMKTIADIVKCGEHIALLPKKRLSEIAVIFDTTGTWHYSRDEISSPIAFAGSTMLQLARTGAPFDTWCAADMSAELMAQYKVIIMGDATALSDEARQVLKELRCSSRTFIWHPDSGAVSRYNKMSSAESRRDLTGTDGTADTDINFGSWRSVYRSRNDISAAELRQICRESGVHIYSETDDVFSCSANVLMLHASSAGMKTVTLPAAAAVTGLRHKKDFGVCKEFSFHLEHGETALFELEYLPEGPGSK